MADGGAFLGAVVAMSSPPSPRDLDGLIAETWGAHALTRPDVMALLEPYREHVDRLMDDFDDAEQSWRDYCGAIYGWDRRAQYGDGAIPFAVQDAVVELLKQPAPTPTDVAPRLAGDSIRVVGASLPGTGCNLHGARVQRTQSGYTLTATSDMRAAVAIHAALGSVVGVPFLGDQGESVVVSLYLNGTTISFSARERDTVGVECDLMRPSGVIFCDTVKS